MSTRTQAGGQAEVDILARLIRPERGDLTTEAAQALLRLKFEQEDLDRIHELLTRNQADALNPEEQAELEVYLRIGTFLDLMHAKASRAIRRPS